MKQQDVRARLIAQVGWGGVAALAAYVLMACGMVGQLVWFLWRSGMWAGAAFVVVVVCAVLLFFLGLALGPPAAAGAMQPRYYIMQRQCSGNCAIWWRAGGNGYTCNLDEAEVMSHAEAEKTCRSRPGEDFAVPEQLVRMAVRRHADVNVLREMGYGRIAE